MIERNRPARDAVPELSAAVKEQFEEALLCADIGDEAMAWAHFYKAIAADRDDRPAPAPPPEAGRGLSEKAGVALGEKEIDATMKWPAILAAHPWVRPGSRAVHHSGRTYLIEHLANLGTADEDKFPVQVVYRGQDNGRVWARPLSQFVEKFTPAGA